MARLVAEPLSQTWGQQAIVVNQAGAGGLIASRALAASPADGYTLFLAGGSVFVVLPEVNKNLSLRRQRVRTDRVRRRAALYATDNNKIGIKSVAELIELSNKGAGRARTPLRAPTAACST